MNAKFKHSRHIAADILEKASEWQARLWSEEVSEQDHVDCNQWRAAHPEHEQAWQLLNSFNQKLEELPQDQHSVLLTQPSGQILQWIKGGSTLCAILGLTVFVYQQDYFALWTADYRKATGEVRTLELQDGTQLILASNSAVDVNFSDQQREIKLIQGQIFVETGHKYAQQPRLTVQSLKTTIEPMGTQFTVNNQNKNLNIAVYEGAVKISSAMIHPDMILRSGWQTTFDPKQPQAIYQPVDDLQLSWIRHKLVVEQMPLCDFLQEVSQYRSGYIYCDNTLQTLKVSGSYSLNDTDTILQQIAYILPVEINQYSPYLVTVKTQ